MGFFDRFKRRLNKPKPAVIDNPDYFYAMKDGVMFFKCDKFIIGVTSVKFTVPPENWTEKEYGIITFQYDIYDGAEAIEQMGAEEFETLVGPWIRSELMEE